jgi:hypothetical protein
MYCSDAGCGRGLRALIGAPRFPWTADVAHHDQGFDAGR